MKEKFAIFLSLLLLGGIAAEKWTLLAPADASAYHARIRKIAESAPLRIGDWQGRDVPVPPTAIKLLKPNVLISREFTNPAGQRVSFLLVQCADTRELVAHYPPVCYPGRGYTLASGRLETGDAGGLRMSWTRYEFVQQSFDQFASIVVRHFIVMPDGTVCGDMAAMRTSAARVTDRFYGAAQVHLVTDARMSQADREAAYTALIEGHRPLLDAIRSGIHPGQ